MRWEPVQLQPRLGPRPAGRACRDHRSPRPIEPSRSAHAGPAHRRSSLSRPPQPTPDPPTADRACRDHRSPRRTRPPPIEPVEITAAHAGPAHRRSSPSRSPQPTPGPAHRRSSLSRSPQPRRTRPPPIEPVEITAARPDPPTADRARRDHRSPPGTRPPPIEPVEITAAHTGTRPPPLEASTFRAQPGSRNPLSTKGFRHPAGVGGRCWSGPMTAIANHPHRVTSAIADARARLASVTEVPAWSMDATETTASLDQLAALAAAGRRAPGTGPGPRRPHRHRRRVRRHLDRELARRATTHHPGTGPPDHAARRRPRAARRRPAPHSPTAGSTSSRPR